MPIISVPDLAQKLKAIHFDVPVVKLSGCAVLPDLELLWVDADFGSGTSLDSLLFTLRVLTYSRTAQRSKAGAANWAEST